MKGFLLILLICLGSNAFSQSEESEFLLLDTLVFDGPNFMRTIPSLDSLNGSVLSTIEEGVVYLIELSEGYYLVECQTLAIKNKQGTFDIYYLRPWPSINGHTLIDSVARKDFNHKGTQELILYLSHLDYIRTVGGDFTNESNWVQIWNLDALDILFAYPSFYCHINSPSQVDVKPEQGSEDASKKVEKSTYDGGVFDITMEGQQITIAEQPSDCAVPPVVKEHYHTVTYQYTPAGFVAIKRSIH